MRLLILPAALVELQHAADFYAQQGGVDLANAFVDEFDRTTKLLAASPQLGGLFRGQRRRYFLRRFPYGVIYQIAQDELRVIALAHQRRRPSYWLRRK